MGLLSKLKKKSIGHKLVGKAIKKDPIAGKLVKHDPLMQKAVGMDKKESGGHKMTIRDALRKSMGNRTSSSTQSRPTMSGNTPPATSGTGGRRMVTGGNTPATPSSSTPTASRLNKLGGMNRPVRRGRYNP